MFRLILAGVLSLFATGAMAQEPYESQQGRLCLEQWITRATQALNGYNGAATFNDRKPWRINRFGLFMGQGMFSNYEPDNWVAMGASRDSYMWNSYTSEEAYPAWPSADFRAAQVPGLRYAVRACIGGTAGATTGAAPVAPAPAAQIPPTGFPPVPASATCPASLQLLASYPGVVLGCNCPPAGAPGTVWGSGPYTSDSSLCTAARHAGVVGTGGGIVWATTSAGLSNYNGSSRFGITSRNYGSYGSSTTFLNAPAGISAAPQLAACPVNMQGQSTSISCYCDPSAISSGSVWGTGIYTNDSKICRAALHAGMLNAAGGPVTVQPLSDAGSYQGSIQNGVSSSDYGAWRGAFTFN